MSPTGPPPLPPQDPPTRIPKIITIVWCGPHDPPVACVESWRTMHPDDRGWRVQIVTEEALDWLNQPLIDQLPNWADKATCIAYEVLELSGGFVIHADIECLKPLDTPGGGAATGPLIDFCGMSEALASYRHESLEPGVLSTVFLAGRPGASVWRRCVEEVAKVKLTPAEARGDLSGAIGTGMLTRVAKEFTREKLQILPSKMFSPEHSSGAKSPGKGPSYGHHYFGTGRGYARLRKWGCQCKVCRNSFTALRPPWG